jgi:ABC-type antimicrobial peptide transport system permease subunit
MRLVLIGMAVGGGAVLLITPLMRNLLFGVEAHDPAVIGCTVVVLGIAALLAMYVPAYRATRVDPVSALRWE